MIFDDFRVGGDIGEVGQARRQFRDEGDAADLFERALAPQLLAEENGVNRGAGLGESDHRPEDELMGADVEVARGEQLYGLMNEAVVEDDRAEDRTLGTRAVRQRAVEEVSHGSPPCAWSRLRL